jgi:hypothetical protein
MSTKTLSTIQIIAGVAVAAALLLIIPLTASFITSEMQWTLSDYVLVWVMLFTTGITYMFVSRLSSDNTYRAAVALAVVTGLLMVWSNLAVGIIGNEDNMINVVYFIILMLGFIGAFFVRFRSKGLAQVTGGMVLLLATVAIYAILIGMQDWPESSVMEIIGVHMFFMTPLALSAILFHQHSQKESLTVINSH